MSEQDKAEQVRAALRKWLSLRDEAGRLRTQRDEVSQRLQSITNEGNEIYESLAGLMGNESRIVAIDGHAILVGSSMFGPTTIQVVTLVTLDS